MEFFIKLAVKIVKLTAKIFPAQYKIKVKLCHYFGPLPFVTQFRYFFFLFKNAFKESAICNLY